MAGQQQVLHHVKDEQRAHSVIRKALPHLGGEQEGQPVGGEGPAVVMLHGFGDTGDMGVARAVAYRMPGSPYTNWFVVAFLVLVAVLLSLDEGTRIALYVAPVWFTILGIGYQIAKPRAERVA
jgi:hypothetical protein